jgi:hypothetical protein
MPGPVRSASVTRALIVALGCLGVAPPAWAQSVPANAPQSSTVVVFLPTRTDSVAASRITRAIGGREVVAIYTTDTPAAVRVAHVVHGQFGGSLIPYDRLGRDAGDFGDVLYRNAVDHGARQHPGTAVLVVAEPDLMLPFLRHAISPPGDDGTLAKTAADGFVVSIEIAGNRSVRPLPF